MKTLRILVAVIAVGLLPSIAALTGCEREALDRTLAEQQIDQKITEEVMTAFGNSPSSKFPDVQVASFKGRVQLSGFVASGDQKASAGIIAKGVPGVVGVESKISQKWGSFWRLDNECPVRDAAIILRETKLT